LDVEPTNQPFQFLTLLGGVSTGFRPQKK
jgi:hypothetical protein